MTHPQTVELLEDVCSPNTGNPTNGGSYGRPMSVRYSHLSRSTGQGTKEDTWPRLRQTNRLSKTIRAAMIVLRL